MFTISVMELVVCLSEVIDLMSEEIQDHHKRVACGAYQLAKAYGIDGAARRDIVIAAALHDIGGLSLEARKTAALHFEDTNSHAEKGYKLLSGFESFNDIAEFVRYHHTPWNDGNGRTAEGRPVPLASQIILLADRISVMLTPGILALTKAQEAAHKVECGSGSVYNPELVAVFRRVSARDVFWLNTMSPGYYERIMKELKADDIVLSGAHTDAMLALLSNIIDFRSVFTTMHSKGVSVVAERLARLAGFCEGDCHAMRVAALLHDIGKLAIPTEILDKPGPLSEYERDIMRTHSFYTDRVLSSLSGFEQVQKWAASHHESLNGQGYPFGYGEEHLSLGAKIMKVADIFVALMEDRPYRPGMPAEKTFEILWAMAAKGEVDAGLVTTLSAHTREFEALLYSAQLQANQAYSEFTADSPPWDAQPGDPPA